MKLRIQNNTIRIRVNEKEVISLSENEKLISKTLFPEAFLEFSLSQGGANAVSYEQNRIEIIVDSTKIKDWTETDQITISMEFDLPNEEKLSILVEKDMKV